MLLFSTTRKQLILCLLFQALLLVASLPKGFQPGAECQEDSDCPADFECTELNRCFAKDCLARGLSVAGQHLDPVAFKNRIWEKAGATDDFLIQLKRSTSDDEFAQNQIVQNLMSTIHDHSYELLALASVVQACENGDSAFRRHLEEETEEGTRFSRWMGRFFDHTLAIFGGEQSSTPRPSPSPQLTQRCYTGFHIEGGFILDASYTQFQESGNNTQTSPIQFKRGCFGAEVGAGAEVSIFVMITSNLAAADVIGGSFLLDQDIGIGAAFGAAAGLFVTGEQWDSSCPMYIEITFGGGIGIGIGGSLCRTGVVTGTPTVAPTAVPTGTPCTPPPNAYVFGSSVALGVGAPSNEGYAFMFARDVVKGIFGQELINEAISGYTTVRTLPLLIEVLGNLNYAPQVVIIGLSTANEGLVGTTTQAEADAVAAQYEAGIETIVNTTLAFGVQTVLVGSVYPQNNYNSMHYAVLQQVFANQMTRLPQLGDVAMIDYLTPLDNGSGGWLPGTFADAGHPNAAGHTIMSTALAEVFYNTVDLVSFPGCPT